MSYRIVTCCLMLIVLLMHAGCQKARSTPWHAVQRGDFTTARLDLYHNMVNDRGDRQYLLDRMRVGVLTLADGYPDSAQTIFEDVYDFLRTQGINEDKTVASVVVSEQVKRWKGEPFEQALAMMYYGLVQASQGSWDNARAAAANSLFYLRDFGEDDAGRRIDTYEIARRSLMYERALDAGLSEEEARARADYLDHGYVVRESNFTLGYFLHGIASQQMGRDDEAADYFSRVVELNGRLEPLIHAFDRNLYNTVLVVSFGYGPRKEGYGPDKALARFVPRTFSDAAPLYMSVNEHEGKSYPQVTDVNRMARDHMWNNLEDVRQAKSTIGNVMLYGGLASTAYGLDRGREEAVYAGLAAMAAGMFLKAGAEADTRYCDVMPQRFYVVPVYISDPNDVITLQVEGKPETRLRLTGIAPPRDPHDQAQLRYVRLLGSGHGTTPRPGWANSGRIYYNNPHTPLRAQPALPYIIGGNCVRPPSEMVLDDYQVSGYLHQYNLSQLRELYRAEGIFLTRQDQGGYAGRHVLEGGNSLVSPLAGTTGFARLFGQTQKPYQPQSPLTIQAAQQIAAENMTTEHTTPLEIKHDQSSDAFRD